MDQPHVADDRRPDGTPRRAPVVVDIVSPAWESAVGPAGTLKKQFTAHLGGAQVGRLLVYREADGRFDISGIGVRDDYQGRRVATQLLDFAFLETGADHLTLSTGTTGDGTQLVLAYGEGRREGRRVVERPARMGPAFQSCDEGQVSVGYCVESADEDGPGEVPK
jgi:ribosomal protein S18 acetylase RimI-like enzyme